MLPLVLAALAAIPTFLQQREQMGSIQFFPQIHHLVVVGVEQQVTMLA
jgi:hypothetical protein